MKKYLFIIALLLPFSLIAQVREHWLPDNSILKKKFVPQVFKDSKSRLWILNDIELIMKDANGDWHSGMQDSIPMYNLPTGLTTVGNIKAIYEDFYENIIFITSDGVALYNHKNEWIYYSKSEPRYSMFKLAFDFIPANNNKIYYEMFDGLLYLQYEPDSSKYSFDYHSFIKHPSDISMSECTPFLHDSNIIMHNFTQDIKYNIYTDVWSWSADDRGIIPEFGLSAYFMKIFYANNNRYLLSLYNKGIIELEIKEKSGLIKSYSAPIDTHAVTRNLVRACTIIDTTDNTFIVWDNLNLYSFNESKGFMKLSLPDSVRPDSLPLVIVDIFLADSNEVWLSGNSGIIKCDLQELLSTGVALNTTASIEINSHLPMMNIYRVYPQPNTSYVNFEYYMQSGLFSDIKVSVYDSFGEEVKNIKYENITKESIISTLRLSTTQFAAGVYVIVFDDGANKATTKFIVEK